MFAGSTQGEHEGGPTTKHYEVTVPVTVTVERDAHGAFALTDVVMDSWGGFFSEAEEAAGVWDVDEEAWARHDQDAIYDVAACFVSSCVFQAPDKEKLS